MEGFLSFWYCKLSLLAKKKVNEKKKCKKMSLTVKKEIGKVLNILIKFY